MTGVAWAVVGMAAVLNVWSTVLFVWTRRERRRLEFLRYGLGAKRIVVTDETLDQAVDRLRRPQRGDLW